MQVGLPALVAGWSILPSRLGWLAWTPMPCATGCQGMSTPLFGARFGEAHQTIIALERKRCLAYPYDVAFLLGWKNNRALLTETLVIEPPAFSIRLLAPVALVIALGMRLVVNSTAAKGHGNSHGAKATLVISNTECQTNHPHGVCKGHDRLHGVKAMAIGHGVPQDQCNATFFLPEVSLFVSLSLCLALAQHTYNDCNGHGKGHGAEHRVAANLHSINVISVVRLIIANSFFE